MIRRGLFFLLLGWVVWAGPVAAQKPTPPPTPVKPPVPPTPTAPTRLAPTPTATVTVPAILLPTTGTARWSGWVGLAALALADLGVLYAIRRRQA